MSVDQNPVHPELRQAIRTMPSLSFRHSTYRLIRLLANLQPKAKIPAGIRIEQVWIQSQDPNHKIRLRMYRPDTQATPAPVLVWMHGGGYIIGRPEMDDPLLIRFARELKIIVVSIDYRLAPEHPFPTPLNDCYAALKWVNAQALQMGMDPSRIAIGGNSAGGGLAAALAHMALDRGEIKPVFQMLVYPMLDDRTCTRSGLANNQWMTWSPESNQFGWESYLQQACGCGTAAPYSVPARRENLIGLPPAWIGVGTLDLFYDENVAYANRLVNNGVECDLVGIPGAFHGFDYYPRKIKIIEDFRQSQITTLKRHLFA